MDHLRTQAKKSGNLLIPLGGVLSLLFAAGTMFYTGQQVQSLHEQVKGERDVVSAQFVDQINQRVVNSGDIITSIEGDDTNHTNSFPVWDQEGGKFSEDDISGYIDNFDEIGNLYMNGLINKQMAYEEFSYGAEKAWCNNSIRTMVHDDRKSDGSGKYNDYRTDWWGFQQLATISLQIDKKTCNDMNDL